MPLSSPEAKGQSDIYCKYCSDEAGNLRPRGEISPLANADSWVAIQTYLLDHGLLDEVLDADVLSLKSFSLRMTARSRRRA